MNYTVTNDWNDVARTGMQGYLHISYQELVAKLGQPAGPSGDGKVQAEWIIKTPEGVVVTIYDYKEDKHPRYVKQWHVGGKGPLALAVAYKIFGMELADW